MKQDAPLHVINAFLLIKYDFDFLTESPIVYLQTILSRLNWSRYITIYIDHSLKTAWRYYRILYLEKHTNFGNRIRYGRITKCNEPFILKIIPY